jgi:ABC-type bacteriocin/lantibiotic exporter with double-glycine peptidase domain
MATGVWETHSKAGYTYDVLMQEEEADCGPCCTAMVVHLIDGSKPTSGTMQKLLPKGSYKKSTRDRAGMVATPLAALGLGQETHSAGTYIHALSHALRAVNIPNTAHSNHAGVAQAILSATPANPVIVRVGWAPNDSGHWVVIANVKGTALFILDPAYGFNVNTGTDYYAATWYPGAGPGKAPVVGVWGYFTPYWLQVD